MGKNVYLTKNEIIAVIDTCSEWCEIMSTGDEASINCVDSRLNDGLGSALKKLSKNTAGYEIYKKY